ncbi:MAG TPA: translation initiation factor IF-2 [Planctomycetota bacterium]|nr:translation initiation factor IF-2 [Planctomycetota bacterium]
MQASRLQANAWKDLMSSTKKADTKDAPVPPTDIRIHDLAKQLGIPSKDVLEKAQALFGKEKVKSHASLLKPGQVDRLKAKLGTLKHEHEERERNTRILEAREEAARAARAQVAAETIAEPPPVEVIEEVPPAPEQVEAPEPVEEPVAEPAPAEQMEEAPAEVVAVAPEEPASVDGTAAAVPAEAAPIELPAKSEEKKRAAATATATTAERKESRFGVVVPAEPKKETEKAKDTARHGKAATKAAPAQPEKKPASALLAPLHGPPKKVLSGPVVAPPVQRDGKRDDRFGVVVSAAEAEKLHGPTQQQQKAGGKKGPRDTSVDSKPVDDFKPQVSYPSIPESFTDEEERGKAAGGGGGGRRGIAKAAPGLKGFGSGPRRGVGLLRGDDDRYRGARKQKRGMGQAALRPVVTRAGPAEVTSPVSIKALCEALGIKSNTLIKKFFDQGKIVNINTILADSDAELYALEFDPLKFGISIKKARDVEEEMLKKADVADKFEDLKPRAPVVTIMGHVDHGKTSLLDYIRQTKVAAGEAGGITQHIGAYKVAHKKGEVAFIDTPGHKAFTEMRARGANVTDVVVLVVAANDGVMPQTEEAISHAKQANKKIVVALNKIDMPEANPDKVKGQLASKELFVEGYGGDVGCVEVSAKTGQGVDDLLDRILLEAEVLELKANPKKAAVGHVVEAHKDQGRGIVCTLLVQEGTLHQGDVIICGHAYGSVRQILSDNGTSLKAAGPATPVLVTGLSDVPLSGERFHVLDSIKAAAEIAEQRAMRMRQEGLVKRTHVTMENWSDMLAKGAVASLKLVLKVDVQGSLAPLRDEINRLSTGEARIDIVHEGVGAINETDVLLADASDAVVIGFSVNADPGARRMAEERGVDLRNYTIIYEVVDEMRMALEGILAPIEKEVVQGHVAVRQTFKISKVGTIAGCFVTDGLITRASNVRLIRDGKTVWTGKLASLKRVKDDAKEVRSGFECGIKLENFDDIKQGDLMEAFTTEQVKRTLEAK